MANIQRGDQRQYYQQVASKTNIGDMALLANEALNTGMTITQKANEATLANNQIKLSNDFYVKNNEINTKYQADPTNPEREVELREAFEQLASEYEINPVCQGQWNTIKNNVYNRFSTYNTQWSEKQLTHNAQVNLQNGCKDFINQAFILGKNGASVDDIRLYYANGSEALKNGSMPRLGEVYIGEAMSLVTHDFMSNYINGAIEANPAQALKSLENEGIINDIGNPDTVKKLKQSAQQKMLKQVEVEAVDRVADYILKNDEIFSKALDGTLTTAEAQDFLSDENVDKNMRKILVNMLGYDEDELSTGTSPEKQTYATLTLGNKQWTFLSEKGKLRQPTQQEKAEFTNELYLEGSRLLNGIEGQTPQQQIRKIAEYQSKLAQASYFGMNKTDYEKMMSTFVMPATKDIQAQAQKYNANMSSWNPISGKYGWQQIDKYFNQMEKDLGDKPTKTELEDLANEKALASIYYWSSLNNYASQRGISINDIFGLSREERAEIYNKSAKEAIERAKATSETPSLWFKSANPQYVSQIRSMLPNDNANNVITNVAVASASNPLMSDKDFDDIVNREVQKEYAKMRTQNKATVFAGNTKYDEHINNYAMMYGIDPLLVKAVIKQESGFNPNAESSAGAVGLMQLMPATARSLGVKNAKDPKQNIAGGTKYLASLLKQFDGNIPLALSAYNAGAGTVKKYGNKIPPYKETQNYVKNIMATYNSIKG